MNMKEETKRKITNVIYDYIGEFKEEDEMSTYMDSLEIFELAMEFEDILGITFVHGEIEQCKTFTDLINLIDSKYKEE